MEEVASYPCLWYDISLSLLELLFVGVTIHWSDCTLYFPGMRSPVNIIYVIIPVQLPLFIVDLCLTCLDGSNHLCLFWGYFWLKVILSYFVYFNSISRNQKNAPTNTTRLPNNGTGQYKKVQGEQVFGEDIFWTCLQQYESVFVYCSISPINHTI